MRGWRPPRRPTNDSTRRNCTASGASCCWPNRPTTLMPRAALSQSDRDRPATAEQSVGAARHDEPGRALAPTGPAQRGPRRAGGRLRHIHGRLFDARPPGREICCWRRLETSTCGDDFAAGVKYVMGCIPAPMDGPVSIDWRYIPSSSLGGDTIGYHWIDDDHLALYLIDVTGHGLDSALLSVTITNVLRSGSLTGADMRRPDQVLASTERRVSRRTAWRQVLHDLVRRVRTIHRDI